MHKFKKSGKISRTLLVINTIPILILGILTTIFSSRLFSTTVYYEVEVELKNVAATIINTLDLMYPGDYELVQNESPTLYKGGHNLTNDYTLIDNISTTTDLKITLFYQNIRAITTLHDQSGHRIVGSLAPEETVKDVLQNGEPHFYKNIVINDSEYFSLYLPLHNSDGSVIGMLFLGKPMERVNTAIMNAIYPLLLMDILAIIVIIFFNFTYNKRFVSSLLKIHGFLAEVSKGNLSAQLDSSVLNRNDELSEIGHSAMYMQSALSNMIERDELTGLYNRRFGQRKLRQVIAQSDREKIPFCIAAGDIDFFKTVNDTYGHECGDVVLKELADCLQKHMASKGFAARFGGEEFLLVYENRNLASALTELEQLLSEIRNMECRFEGQTIHITMTFGLAEGGCSDFTHLIREADNLLYRGKAGGKNRIEY